MTPKYIEVQSDLFRESGANVTDEDKINRYAQSMWRNYGWGKFPAIHATLHEVSLEDFEDFVEASGDGAEHELAWSRPLDFNDIGRVYASIDDGHHRAYAASRMGIPLRVKKLKKNPEITLEDFLDGSESIPDDEVEGFLTTRGLVPIEVVFANGDRVLLIDFDDDRYVLESDGSSFDAKRAEAWLSSKLMHNVGDMVGAEELPDFWQYPPPLYHATRRENYDEIMAKGLGARSRSRVGSNRWVGSSVFTSTDPEAIDSYGDLIFEIDTVGMARDGITYDVGLEPGIVEDLQARALAAKIGLYEYEPGVLETSEGLAESTVIIFGHIPPKYLSTPFE